jgi:gas vesicle protein
MSTKADELRRDIEQTRGELGTTLEELGDRVAPKKVVARTKADIADKVDDVKGKMSPRRLVSAPVEAVRAGVRNVMGSDGGPDSASFGAEGGSRGQLGASAIGKAAEVSRRAGDTAGSAVEGLRDGASSVKTKAEGSPLAAGLLAFAAGFLAASLLPPSERERELVQKAREEIEPFGSEAAEIGKGIAGELQGTAQRGLQRVKERAAESVEQVRTEAQSTARQLQGRAEGAAGTVTSRAKSAKEKVAGETQQSTRAVKGEAKQAVGSVKGQAKDAAGTVKGKAKESARTVKGEAPQSASGPRVRTASRPSVTRRSSRSRVSAP